MFKIVTGIVGAAIGSISVIATWLFWPLPTAVYDWRTQALQIAEHEECVDLSGFLVSVARNDPVGVEIFMSEASFEDRCPQINDIEMTTSKPGFTPAQEFETQIWRTIETFREHRANGLPEDRELRLFLQDWAHYRDLRRAGGAGYFGWPELVITLRCERWFRFNSDRWWYELSNSVYAEIGRPSSLRPWDRRAEWCVGFAEVQSQSLLRDLGVETKPFSEQYAARLELVEMYDRRVWWWGN